MTQLRKCSKCKQAELRPVSRKMQIYNTVVSYKCDHCDHKVELQPAASIGVNMTVGALALAFWASIIFSGNSGPGAIELSIFIIAILLWLFTIVGPILVHFQNPRVDDAKTPVSDISVDGSNAHMLKRPILWLEKLGFLGGLIAPLIFIGGFLGIAAFIGYINFTYF